MKFASSVSVMRLDKVLLHVQNTAMYKGMPLLFVQYVYCHSHALSSAVLCRLYFGKKPFLVVSDPDLLKLILIKNFDKFPNRFVS